MKFSFYFFPNQFVQKIVFFCVLLEENQDTFSEKCSVISGVLQGLVKVCKKYMEVNNFLLLIFSFEKYLLVQGFFNYSTRRQSIVFQSSLAVLFEGKLLEWRQLFSGEISWRGSNFPDGNFPPGQLSGGNYAGAIIQGVIIRGEIFLGGNCPRTR